MKTKTPDVDEWIEDLPNAWCQDCEHPRCLGKKESFKHDLRIAVEEIIGEDDGGILKSTPVRNILRTEQRQRLARFMGERDG